MAEPIEEPIELIKPIEPIEFISMDEPIDMEEPEYLVLHDGNRISIINTDWIFISFFIISQLILLFQIILIILICLVILKILGYFVNAIKTKPDPLVLKEVLDDHYEAYKNEYPLIYRIRKSKVFSFISQHCSELLKKYVNVKSSNPDKLKQKQSKLFGCRGGCEKNKEISQILKILVESQDIQISGRSGRIRSIQTKLKIFINDRFMVKFSAKLGIFILSTKNSIVPRIIGVVIGSNVLLKPIDDKKLLSPFHPAPSYIERIAEAKIHVLPESNPKQILFLPGPRRSNQVTIVTLGSKFKFMCSPEEHVGLEKDSQLKFVPLSQRTKTFQDMIRNDDVEIGQNNDIIFQHLARRVKAEKLNVFNEEN